MLPALLLALPAAAGCSGGATEASSDPAQPSAGSSSEATSGSPSGSPSGAASPSSAVPAGTPACAEVWRAGGTVPRGYRGCEQDGAFVAQDALGCSSGQRIVRFDDRWWAVPGGPVQEAAGPLAEDPDHLADVRSCRG